MPYFRKNDSMLDKEGTQSKKSWTPSKTAKQREPNIHSKSLVTTLKNLALLEGYVPFIVVCLCSLHGLAMSNQIKVEMANPLYLERKVSIHIFCILARGWFIIHNTLSNPKRKSISELQNVQNL